MPQPPPCWQRDEWTRDSNKVGPTAANESKSPAQMAADSDARYRAQLTCLTVCDQRAACLKMAMAQPAEEDHFIWGGYSAEERKKLRAGTLDWPKYVGHPHYDLLHQLLSGVSGTVLADERGCSLSALHNLLNNDIWALRRQQNDDLAGYFTDTSGSPETVAAA